MGAREIPKPDLVRSPEGGFAWVDHRIKMFWDEMSREELLLYFFLISTSNATGCSWYSSRQITKILKIGPETLIRARETLERRRLIATKKDELSQRIVYQVLPLPVEENQDRLQIPYKPKIEKKPLKSSRKKESGSDRAPETQHSLNIQNLEKIQDFLKSV